MRNFFKKSREDLPPKETSLLLDKMHECALLDLDVKNLLAREIAQNDIDPLAFVLHSGLLSLETVEQFLTSQFTIQSVDLTQLVIDNQLLDIADAESMLSLGMMPFKVCGNVLSVAMDQPYLTEKLSIAEQLFDGVWVIEPFFCKNMSVSEAIDMHFTHANKTGALIAQLCSSVDENPSMVAPDQLIIKLVNSLLLEALEERASDIHFDSGAYFVIQRLRVDGVLREKRHFSLDVWGAIKIRLKVLANIDITESQLPQDGSFFVRLRNRDCDFRLSSLPAVNGEAIVLRLNSHKSIVHLESLGFSETLNHALRALIKQPSGLILIGGPTGSGKTTTLYALLQTLNLKEINVATLEDPVEHIMPMIRQTNVQAELGLDFAQGIRSLLRQDPDVLLIGEIRDAQSAELAVKAALTGHLVLATVHAAYIQDIPTRMIDLLGNESSLYSQTLAIMAQRLLRKICHSCKGAGCEECSQSGYLGRLAIMEYVFFDEHNSMRDIAHCNYQSLAELAELAVNKRITDSREVERVMGVGV